MENNEPSQLDLLAVGEGNIQQRMRGIFLSQNEVLTKMQPALLKEMLPSKSNSL